MNIDKLIFRIAGTFILIGSALTYFHHPYWLAVPAFVGANLLQASFTGFCPMASILKKFGVTSGCAFN
ncbi:MAG: DUF2892 domain-containing protein [Gammaproteobacteria bacterium]|nr:DUF2892 domain-containing protein [Gammaproteobacteria bacterium]